MADSGSALQQSGDAELLAALRAGSERAAADLFSRYYDRLRRLVETRRGWRIRRAENPSDIVQSVFQSVFTPEAAAAVELDADGEADLWPLLATIAMRKMYNRTAYLSRERRDAAREVAADNGLQQALHAGPSPEDAAMVSEVVDQLVAAFPQRRRRIVAMLLEGREIGEIGQSIGVSQRTVYHTRAAVAEALKGAMSEPT